MTENATPVELARLRADLAAQRATTDALLARLARVEQRRTRPRHARLLLALLLAAALALVPALALADFAFLDLNPGSPHNDNIAAIKAAGITKGCNPPDYTDYCPNGTVTREEMASFLARAAGLGTNPPVANALTAVSATNATNATNAATVGGLAPSGLLRVARAVSTNRDEGDGSANLLTVTTAAPTYTVLPGATATIVAPGTGFVLVFGAAECNASGNDACLVRLHETTPGAPATAVSPPVALYSTDPHGGGASPTYVFPVGTAGTKSFAIEAAKYPGNTSPVTAANGVVTALFVPFGYDGGTTLAP